MMTTLAAMLGALPLALGFGEGGEMRRPLGIAIVGGLIVSQVLTLYTTPVSISTSTGSACGRARVGGTPFRRLRDRRDAGAGGMMRKRLSAPAAALAALAADAAAWSGPITSGRPPSLPARYKELAGWKPAQPSDALDRGAWWSVYHDPVLDGLERQVATSPTRPCRPQEAAFRQAARSSPKRAPAFPDGRREHLGAAQQRGSGGSFATSTRHVGIRHGPASDGLGGSSGSFTRTSYSLEGTVDWDLDVWGRIRRQVESNVASAQASAADLANARLSAQAQLATDYFQLRAADA